MTTAGAPVWQRLIPEWLRSANVRAAGGLALIWPVFALDRTSHFPGWLALLPTVGADDSIAAVA